MARPVSPLPLQRYDSVSIRRGWTLLAVIRVLLGLILVALLVTVPEMPEAQYNSAVSELGAIRTEIGLGIHQEDPS